MTGPREALIRHLELAVEAYGDDLPLAVPTPASAPAAPPQPEAAPPRATPAPVQESPQAPEKEQVATQSTPPEPAASDVDPAAALAELQASLVDCTACALAEGRTQVVFGDGNARAQVMFVGEAPGFHEDRRGLPFVGKAGELLNRIISGGMGLQREDVYIANVNKCRPPNNRDPAPDEVAACLPHLRQQVAIIRPAVIVALGRVAAHNLLSTTLSMGRLRGRDLSYEGIPVVATWHPAYLLRNPAAKAETWEDVKRTNRLLGRPEIPER